MQPQTKKTVKIILIVFAVIVFAFIAVVGGYVAYVAIQYHRIADNTDLEVSGLPSAELEAGVELSVMTYNLGFGAYSPEYSFFMDEGIMEDGTRIVGKHAKGISKADVDKNVTGQLSVAKDQNADFYLFQEVDEKADRSYGINMCKRGRESLIGRCSVYAENFHTANLLYPFNDPIGQSNSGIMTYSRFAIESAVRRSFPVTDDFIDKLFDLDRCFSVSYLPIKNKTEKLALINLHMSAYDEGGKVRVEQLAMLNAALAAEREKGNYVIAGGDFNHCLIADLYDGDADRAFKHFAHKQQTPDWLKNSVLTQSELTDGFTLVAPVNEATCRGADMPYEKGVSFVTVIDGFIVSDNVSVINSVTVDTQYAYSDHNPVKLTFVLE